MKISRDWLSDFIDWIETDPDVIADQMTRCMGEIDEVVRQGKFLDGVVVAKIISLDRHPNADRLSVCTVETDLGTKNVVCGGTNLQKGMLVAFAHVGTTVLAGGKEVVKLGQVKIRGVESEGMICAAEEIEIEHLFPPSGEDGDRPVANLSSGDYKVGLPLREALGMNDVIFHIDNHAITNRPDLFSHIGVARELVAMGLARWKKEPTFKKPKFAKVKAPFVLKNDVPDLIPEYRGCMLSVENTPPTPAWMKRRLEATGWRSINLVVDITNYVLMEVGMPLHAFDADDFSGTLHIRGAKKSETITTLDGVKRPLPEGAVVISDDEGIFDLFGIMGGSRTSNKPTTKNIFIQAGIIQPACVRKTIIAMGHRTDAGTVYEKGVCLKTAEHGLARALELFETLSSGSKVTSASVEWGKEKPKKAISIPGSLFSEFLGTDIPLSEVKTIFKNLGFTLGTSGKNLSITPPAWRNDIEMKQDLIEEVARIHRYAEIPPTLPEASIVPPARDHRINVMRDYLREIGFFELLHLAFSSPESVKKCGGDLSKVIALKNPIGEEVSLMRPSLLPAMLETLERELKSWQGSHMKVYEYGRVFEKGKPEKLELTMLVAAKGATTLPESSTLVAKDSIMEILQKMGYAVTLEPLTKNLYPYAHPGRSALIVCEGKNIGITTELHPNVMEAMRMRERVGVVTLDLDALLAISTNPLIVGSLPVFPSVEFDETFVIGKKSHRELLAEAQAIDPLLQSISVLHLYEKDGVKNITLRFEYRSDERTLTQEEAEKIHTKGREKWLKANG